MRKLLARAGRLKGAAVTILLLFMLLPGGCGAPEALPEEPSNSYELMASVELYFAGATAVNSGIGTETETEELYVVPVKRELAGGGDLLRRTLEELIKGPQPEDGDYFSTIPVTAKIIDLELSDGIAVINFSPELVSDSPGGSLAGIILQQSLVLTATQFPEVEKIVVLVEGDPWTDGHLLWDKPLGPDEL